MSTGPVELEPIVAALAALRLKVDQLNSVATAAATEIAALNQRLADMHLELETWSDRTVPNDGADALLGYARVDGAWQVAVRLGHGATDPARPLTKAPRLVRILAVAHLPAVVDAIADKVEELIKGALASFPEAPPTEPAEAEKATR